MAHRLAPEAEVDLDEIWYYTAKESGGIEIADRLIDSIAERFFLLSKHPHIGRRRDEDLRPGLRSFAVHPYVIFVAPTAKTYSSFASYGVAEIFQQCLGY